MRRITVLYPFQFHNLVEVTIHRKPPTHARVFLVSGLNRLFILRSDSVLHVTRYYFSI